MARYRIGNDMTIVWSITNKDGSPFPLAGKEVHLYYTCERGRFEADIEIQDNVVAWNFLGSNQRVLGGYTLTLEVLQSNGKRAIRRDICNAFTLVGKGCEGRHGNEEGEINEGGEINLVSELDIYRISPIIPQIGDNQNWFVDGTDTGKPSTGKSAYEYAKLNGYNGTEEEYAAECLAVPVLNEESREATEAATKATTEAEQEILAIKDYMSEVVSPAVSDAQEATLKANAAEAQAINAATEANAAANNANNATERAEAAIESFAPAIANKADLENGKIIASQLPDYILGQVMYGGLIFSDNTISPSYDFTSKYGNKTYLSASDASQYSGVYFIATGEIINETIVGVSQVSTGDWIISTGESWEKVDNSDAVTSVAGLVGNVNASALAAALANLKDGNSLARKSEMATINGKSLTQGGNIVIEAKNYDAEIAEQSAKLTELSGENERLKERLEEQDQFIEDLQNTKIDRENDDYYPKMAVGLADNLAGVDVVDSEINFRRSGGGAISDGVARIESIKGNSVVWNQLLEPTHKGNGRLNVYKENGKWVAEVTELGNNSDGASLTIPVIKGQTSVQGHKYLATLDITNDYSLEPAVKIGNAYKTGTFHIIESSNSSLMYLYPFGAGSSQKFAQGSKAVLNVALFCDVTQMFGAGNEPTTIEEFYQRAPMGVDLNAYNEGEVIHMDVQSIESVGVNAWDEEWEIGGLSANGLPVEATNRIRSKNYIPVVPHKTYYVSKALVVFYYDIDYNIISYEAIAAGVPPIPSNCYYLKFYEYGTTTYNHDICINLSDTSINGKYFPYIKRVEDLSIIRKYFPDGMKSAGTAHDEIRYNKASGKWEKVVRIGEVDMGTLDWVYNNYGEGDASNIFSLNASKFPSMKIPSSNAELNVVTSKYSTSPLNTVRDKDKVIMTSTFINEIIAVKDTAYTDLASFKAAMAGVILYYELAEPIVTELDEADQFKDLDYQVWNAGTEKAIAEGKSAPLAADITYGFNAIGKIKELESLVAALRAKVGI